MGYRIIKWKLIMELPPDNPGGRLAGMGTAEVNYLAKAVVISTLRVRYLEKKVMG